MSTNPT